MSSFNFFFTCVQACFIHNVYSQCFSAAGIPNGYELAYGARFAPQGAYGHGIAPGAIAEFTSGIEMGAYGGAGIGDVAVAGEMPVAGTTLVVGQVPILGAVHLAGDLPPARTGGGGAYLY